VLPDKITIRIKADYTKPLPIWEVVRPQLLGHFTECEFKSKDEYSPVYVTLDMRDFLYGRKAGTWTLIPESACGFQVMTNVLQADTMPSR